MHPRPLSPEDSVLLLNYPPRDRYGPPRTCTPSPRGDHSFSKRRRCACPVDDPDTDGGSRTLLRVLMRDGSHSASSVNQLGRSAPRPGRLANSIPQRPFPTDSCPRSPQQTDRHKRSGGGPREAGGAKPQRTDGGLGGAQPPSSRAPAKRGGRSPSEPMGVWGARSPPVVEPAPRIALGPPPYQGGALLPKLCRQGCWPMRESHPRLFYVKEASYS